MSTFMGVKLLSSLLGRYCSAAIMKDPLRKFAGKRFAIDASNCIYRFLYDDTLIPSMYEFCVTLAHYNIKSVFVFDGQFTTQKKSVVAERRKEREKARLTYDTLMQQSNANPDEIKIAKRKMARMTTKHVTEVKELLTALGIPYIEAKKEADEICAELVINGEAYACVSGDTDMFVYGCPRVIRYLSIRKHTCVMFDLEGILNSLSLSFDEFKDVCMVAGTDYNEANLNMYTAYKLWSEYKSEPNESCFCDWLVFRGIFNTKETMIQGRAIYDTEKETSYECIDKEVDHEQLEIILRRHNFINS